MSKIPVVCVYTHNGDTSTQDLSKLFGTFALTGTLFCQSEELSDPPIRTNTNTVLLSIFILNFVSTVKDRVYLSLEECSIFF